MKLTRIRKIRVNFCGRVRALFGFNVLCFLARHFFLSSCFS